MEGLGAGARTVTSATRRNSEGKRLSFAAAAKSTVFMAPVCVMQGELRNRPFFARHGPPRRQRQRLLSGTAEETAPSTLDRRPRVALFIATSSTGREPTANGRAAQVMLRAPTWARVHCASRPARALVAAEDEGKALHRRPTTLSRIAAYRNLTFDMSGGPKGAKRPLGRPLDGGVRLPRGATSRLKRGSRVPAWWGYANLSHGHIAGTPPVDD
jgi:hypothetical protein